MFSLLPWLRRHGSLLAWLSAATLSATVCTLPALAGKSERPRTLPVTEIHGAGTQVAEATRSVGMEAARIRPFVGTGGVQIDTTPLDIARLGPAAYGDWDEAR